ncbi:MAG: tetratricopeptide repeat protein [Myxococcota bacterium]|nr:tetratricopeptide repeat protein [Myxococcota bacterium]
MNRTRQRQLVRMTVGTCFGCMLALVLWLMRPADDAPASPTRSDRASSPARASTPAQASTTPVTPPPATTPASAQSAKAVHASAQASKTAEIHARITAIREADEACADCHPEQAEGYAATGMAKSMYGTKNAKVIENFDPKASVVRHKASGLVYRAFIDDDGVWWQEESRGPNAQPRRIKVDFIVGSGNHTRSYFGTIEGELRELPMTWYTGKRIWDLSPGYDTNNMRFKRDAPPRCLFCHNDLTATEDGRTARYLAPMAEGISCNRCHGDGREHVQTRLDGKGPEAGAADQTILNPKRLPKTRQNEICQQCHLQGTARILMKGQRWDDYDPRLPLGEYTSIYVPEGPGGPEFGIASHGYRLSLSGCGRIGKATCTDCHNPHQRSSRASYRAACVKCHSASDQTICTSEHATTGYCPTCHLHKGGTNDIPHVRFSDHYIRVGANTSTAPAKTVARTLTDGLDRRTEANPVGPLVRRSLGYFEAWKHGAEGDLDFWLAEAKRLFKTLRVNGTEDARVYDAIGYIRRSEKQLDSALAAFRKVTDLTPDDPRAWNELGLTAQAAGQTEDAEQAFRSAVVLNPDYRIGLVNLANALQQLGRHDEAETYYAKADALAPHLALIANNRGRNAQAQRKIAKAKLHFGEASKRDVMDTISRFNLALLAYDQRQFREARTWLKALFEIEPKFAAGYWLRAKIALDEKEIDAAHRDLKTVIDLNPRQVEPYLELAIILGRKGQHYEAFIMLEQARTQFPTDPRIAQVKKKIEDLRPIPGISPDVYR